MLVSGLWSSDVDARFTILFIFDRLCHTYHLLSSCTRLPLQWFININKSCERAIFF